MEYTLISYTPDHLRRLYKSDAVIETRYVWTEGLVWPHQLDGKWARVVRDQVRELPHGARPVCQADLPVEIWDRAPA